MQPLAAASSTNKPKQKTLKRLASQKMNGWNRLNVCRPVVALVDWTVAFHFATFNDCHGDNRPVKKEVMTQAAKIFTSVYVFDHSLL